MALHTTGDVGGFIKGITPSFSTFGLGGVGFFAWLLIVLVVIVVMTVVIILFILNRRYNKKIIVFEKVGTSFVPQRRDRGMEIRFSTAGDTITYLRKHKKYIPNPTIQTGNREYWYFIREDDEWINFGLENLNEESRKVGAKFLDKEMRFARTSIQKGLKDRYETQGVWAKYGSYIVAVSFVTLIGVFTYLLWDKWIDLAGTTKNAIDASVLVLERTDQILASLDNICSGGSGLIQR